MTSDLVISRKPTGTLDKELVNVDFHEIDSQSHYIFKFKKYNDQINKEYNYSYSLFCFTYKLHRFNIDDYLSTHDYGIYKKFKKLKSYNDNWDGDGALSMTNQVACNFESLYPLLTSRVKRNIDLSLEANGTISIEFSNGKAGLEIGNNAFTYFFFKDGILKGEEHQPYDSFKISRILERMVEID